MTTAAAQREMRTEVRHDYFRYLFPTIIGMVAHSVYCMADVFFVGADMGSTGLAALNVALPIFTVYSSFAIMMGVGAATTISVCVGRGELENTHRIFSQAMAVVVGIGFLASLLTSVFIRPIAYLFGATDLIIDLVVAYMRPVNLLAFVYILSAALSVIVRSDGNPKLVMVAGTVGNLFNILLDWVFVMKMDMGIFGAGLATIIGPCITVGILSLHFLLGASHLHFVRCKFEPATLLRVMKNGVGSSILELSSGFIILLFNLVLIRVSGESAVAVFSVLSNIGYVGKGIFNGMAQAAQPIISLSYGAGRFDKVRTVNRYAMGTAVLFSGVVYAVIALFPVQIMSIFIEPTPELIAMGTRAILLYFLSFPFTGINTILMYYFQSLERAKYTSIIAVMRGVIFISAALLLFSALWGETGVWLSLLAAEATTFLVFEPLKKRFDRRMSLPAAAPAMAK